MSLILEALKKLDREKQAPDRGVLVVGPSAWPSAREGRSAIVAMTVAIAAVAVVATGAALWLLRSPKPAEVAVRPMETAVPRAAAPAAVTAVPTTKAPAQAAPRPSQARPLPRADAVPTPTRAMPVPAIPDPQGSPAADPEAASVGATARAGPAPSKTGTAGSTARDPQLQAISAQDGHPVAVLNGQLVREGDTIDGMRVVRIGADEVEIEIGGRRRVVRF